MDAYGTSHLVMLAVFAAGLPVIVVLGRRERRTGDRVTSRALAVAIPVVFVPTQVVDITTNFELGVSRLQPDEAKARAIAEELGINPDEYVEALSKVPVSAALASVLK